METRELLEKVQKGELSVDEAMKCVTKKDYEALGDYAKLDVHRERRSGFPEVVFCQGKADTHLLSIYKRLFDENGEVLGTRADAHQYRLVRGFFKQAQYDELSGILKIEPTPKKQVGKVAVVTAGTADLPVAQEAALTCEFFGTKVSRIYDVGVAGIHRLFENLEEIRDANCIIAVAGMEGALTSVLGGLVETPVIGVPTSVGYGANFGGLSALLTMLNSCANGIGVVNIDNGYGAAVLATQINRLGVKNSNE